MPHSTSHRPPISRETQRLLLTALFAVFVLWLLARVRYTGDPSPQNAVQPLLAQVTMPVGFSQLAADVARVQSRLPPVITVREGVAALPVGDGLAAGVIPLSDPGERIDMVALDPATGLVLVPAGASAAATLRPWLPRPAEPLYLFAATASSAGVTVTPVLVPTLESTTHPAWPGPIWRTPPGVALEPGSLAFTAAGELAGLVIDDRGRRAIVTPDVLQGAVAQLRSLVARAPGYLGIEVQPLTPPVASASGSTGGVVVVWVDARSPAAGELAPGDVIEQADGERASLPGWTVRAARARANETMTLRVRRRGAMRDVTVQAAPLPDDAEGAAALGLSLRRRAGIGADVLAVAPGTAAARAGIRPGDLITHAGDAAAPTPAQIRAAFDAGTEPMPVLVAVTRGTSHHVVVLER